MIGVWSVHACYPVRCEAVGLGLIGAGPTVTEGHVHRRDVCDERRGKAIWRVISQ